MALVLLDTGLVGLAITEPRGRKSERGSDGEAFRAWLIATSGTVHRFAVADVTRFEATREWHRLGATRQLRKVAAFLEGPTKVPTTPEVWDRAAELWGKVRRQGKPTASPDALDGDAILAAIAALLVEDGHRVIIATTNVGHLSTLGADAREWRVIGDSD